jgi:hypothetical protein
MECLEVKNKIDVRVAKFVTPIGELWVTPDVVSGGKR